MFFQRWKAALLRAFFVADEYDSDDGVSPIAFGENREMRFRLFRSLSPSLTISEDGDFLNFDVLGGGPGGDTFWGDILGTLSDQTELQAALDDKEDAGAVAAHVASPDPHTQYLTAAEGNAAYDALGAATAAVAAHTALGDPHAQYLTAAEGNAAYDALGAATAAVASHEGAGNPHPGYLTEAEADALYDALGDAAAAVAAHEAAGDPHPGYLTPAEGNAAYQPLDSDLTTLAANITTFGHSLVDDANQAAARSTLGLVPGTDIQGFDLTLAALAALDATAGFLEQTAADTFTKRAVADVALLARDPQTFTGTTTFSKTGGDPGTPPTVRLGADTANVLEYLIPNASLNRKVVLNNHVAGVFGWQFRNDDYTTLRNIFVASEITNAWFYGNSTNNPSHNFSGPIFGSAGTTTFATLRAPHGVAPSAPTDGDIWTTTAGIFVRIDGATVGPLAVAGGVSDGDKGDITVSGGGGTWTIDPAAVTLAKMADLAQDQFIGRTTASTGVPETATITAAARTVLDDTTVAAMLATLGGFGAINIQSFVTPGAATYTPYCRNEVLPCDRGGRWRRRRWRGRQRCGEHGSWLRRRSRRHRHSFFSAATVGVSKALNIGAVGAAGSGTNGTNGTNGGAGGNTTWNTTDIVATGGALGVGSGAAAKRTQNTAGGAGGVPTGGTMNITGGDGFNGWGFITLDATDGNENAVCQGGQGGGSFFGSGGRGGGALQHLIRDVRYGESATNPGLGQVLSSG